MLFDDEDNYYQEEPINYTSCIMFFIVIMIFLIGVGYIYVNSPAYNYKGDWHQTIDAK